MEILTLIVAATAAVASVIAAILGNRNRQKLQVAEQRFSDTLRLQPRRLELYTELMKVLRGHDRSLGFKSASDFGGGKEGTSSAIDSMFFDIAGDSTQRLTEARTLVGQVRLVSSADVVVAAEECADKLSTLNSRWMLVLLEYTKDKDKREISAVMTRVDDSQVELKSSIAQFEKVIRSEQGVAEDT